ncbi:MAG: DUF4359 domain-containing protein [Desulfacinum sp.]|nr:DUF4359 domain-containing protein [Desulfacinum sp.]
MKGVVCVLLLIAIFGLLAYTNPSVDDYEHFIHQCILTEAQKENPDSAANLLAPFLGGLVSGYVKQQTLRTDYVFFSIYQARIGDERLRALGILKNFIVLETPSKISREIK